MLVFLGPLALTQNPPEALGRVGDNRLGPEAVFEGGGVGEQLEGGSRRAQGLGGPVELGLLEVLAAHHRPHQSGAGLHHHQGPLHAAIGIGVDRFLGLVLPGLVQAGADRQTTHLQLFLAEHLGQLALQPAGVPGRPAEEVFRIGGLQPQGSAIGLEQFRIGDETGFPHPLEHHAAALQGQLGIDKRRVDRRRRGQAGDQGRLRQGELVGCLGKVNPGRIGNAIGARSQIHEIEILLKDLFLAQLTLDLPGQGRLLELAHQGDVLVEKDHPGQLLGDRAGPFLDRSLADVAQTGPQDPGHVDPVVLVEAAVLRRDEGLLDDFGHLAVGELLPRRRTLLEHHLPFLGKDRQGAGPIEAADAAGIGEKGINGRDDRCLPDGHSTSQGGHQEGRGDPAKASLRRWTRFVVPGSGPSGAGTGIRVDRAHMTSAAGAPTWIRELWPMARAVTSMPRTRNGWALA